MLPSGGENHPNRTGFPASTYLSVSSSGWGVAWGVWPEKKMQALLSPDILQGFLSLGGLSMGLRSPVAVSTMDIGLEIRLPKESQGRSRDPTCVLGERCHLVLPALVDGDRVQQKRLKGQLQNELKVANSIRTEGK